MKDAVQVSKQQLVLIDPYVASAGLPSVIEIYGWP
ncbi:hypothetical protein Mmah_1254 [Methanohalophilus mahii DSM 5219]|uniref:Uncharacterized protein n=1 Tax=Methanohalophilus mahii (strain ATCC 35705 / DSM 5219 / SLP) TaxID=547558 RepID=D5EC57_METMS|nr:hypothetical protein Mmah_1254 [Methanohalophilus mahii DSM 5219]